MFRGTHHLTCPDDSHPVGDSEGFCRAAALIKCLQETRTTEPSAIFIETKHVPHENEVVLEMMAGKVFWG